MRIGIDVGGTNTDAVLIGRWRGGEGQDAHDRAVQGIVSALRGIVETAASSACSRR